MSNITLYFGAESQVLPANPRELEEMKKQFVQIITAEKPPLLNSNVSPDKHLKSLNPCISNVTRPRLVIKWRVQ